MSRRAGLLLPLVGLLAAGCGARGYAVSWDEAPGTFPVEVLGRVGTEATLALALADEAPATARALRLRIHGLGPGEGSVRVNDGPPILLGSSTARLAGPSAVFGIGGALATIELTVPLPAGRARAGRNVVVFRREAEDGSLGYRVLDADVLGAAEAPLADRARLREDDPRAWRAPRPEAAAEGGRLWRGAALVDPVSGRPLRATCADCHTQDGRDLAYFSYSNRAIFEAARRYGLTADQGDAIASHVRNLPVPRVGRPWDPPYQPGPGLDARPVEHWAAGAGLRAVLERDDEAIAALFPRGISADALPSSGRLSVREIPIALPLPTWAEWLPRVHPLDAFDLTPESDLIRRHATIREQLARGAAAYVRGGLVGDLAGWGSAFSELLARTLAAAGGRWTPELGARARAAAAWQAVKHWELAQEFGLEAQALAVHGPGAEARAWPGRWSFLDEVTAAVDRPEAFADERAHAVAIAAWHHLQIVINPGNRRHSEHGPVDWSRAFASLGLVERATGLPQRDRRLVYAFKALQEADNGIGPDVPREGWSLLLADPTLLAGEEAQRALSGLAPQTTRELQEAYFRNWIAKCRSFPPGRYARAAEGGRQRYELDPEAYVPTGDPHAGSADRVAHALAHLRSAGVDAALVAEIGAWARAMWPRGAWP